MCSILSERTDVSRDVFTQSLENAIGPLYQIALNQGYPKWKYEYAVVALWGNQRGLSILGSPYPDVYHHDISSS